jgi:predicted kinase
MDTSRVAGRLIVICGLPGAGKTTLARRMERELHAIRLSADDWMNALAMDLYDEAARGRIESLQWTLARQLLERGSIVVVEWGSWTRAEREALRLGARALGAAVELHYLHASANMLFERVQRRGAEVPPIERSARAMARGVRGANAGGSCVIRRAARRASMIPADATSATYNYGVRITSSTRGATLS